MNQKRNQMEVSCSIRGSYLRFVISRSAVRVRSPAPLIGNLKVPDLHFKPICYLNLSDYSIIQIKNLINRRYQMDDQEKLDLMELVESDKHQIVQFLLAHNIRVKNKISMLFSDGDIDESKLDQLEFRNLWELEYEPSLVKVEFIIEGKFEIDNKLHKTLRQLNINITTRNWPVKSHAPLDYSKTIEDEYNCYQSIQIVDQKDELKIIPTLNKKTPDYVIKQGLGKNEIKCWNLF